MRKIIILLATSALMAAGMVTGAAGIAQASTAHPAAHAAASHTSKTLHRPGPCTACRI